VLDLVNSQRRAAGLRPLQPDNRLSAAAQTLANDLSETGRFSHQDSRGRTVGTRISEQGYNWRTAAENLAKGQRTPEEVVDGWLNSPGHRHNIMEPSVTNLGFGLSRSSDGQLVWVQVFGQPL
jgi:uncharacterized protein YkwD